MTTDVSPVELGGEPIGIAHVAQLSGDQARLTLAPAAWVRIDASRVIVERVAAGGTPIYGLNTGLGGNLGHRVPPAEIEAFQTQIVRGRMIAVGEALPRRLCRAALACRIVELASGRTGVSPGPIRTLVEMFNRGVTPVVPRYGSIGASDIGQASHIAAVAIGHGEAWVGDARLPGAEALRVAGIAPARLLPKDGLGLVSHGPVTIARTALVLHAVGALLTEHARVAALSFEGYRANPTILDARMQAARPAAGQCEAAALLRAMLQGSGLYDPDGPSQIQDALCFREIAPVLGTALAAHAAAVRELEIEMNGVTCSPLVLLEDGDMLSSPNFHSSSLALALDALAIALTHAAWGTALRICKLMTGPLSGLPKYLSPVGGGSAGYVSLQKTTGSLYADVRSRAWPALLDALPVSDTVEDMAPLTHLAAQKIEEQLTPLRYLSAIEALAAAQAVHLRGAPRLADATGALYRAIRARVPPLEADRESGLDVEATRQVLDAFDAAPSG